MSIIQMIKTRLRAKRTGGEVFKDSTGYHVMHTVENLQPREIGSEEFLERFRNADLTKMPPEMRAAVEKALQEEREKSEAKQDARWIRK